MAFTPLQLQIAGVVIFIAITIAAGWWVVRTAMGWHRGSTFAWFHDTRAEELEPDDDDEDSDDAGTNSQ